MGQYTDLLYARPSFVGGMASVIDIGGTLVEYNVSPTPEMADYNALRADWRQVGEDMRIAIQEVVAEPRPAPRRGRRR